MTPEPQWWCNHPGTPKKPCSLGEKLWDEPSLEVSLAVNKIKNFAGRGTFIHSFRQMSEGTSGFPSGQYPGGLEEAVGWSRPHRSV